MEKESSREKKRDSARKSKEYSCYSTKSVRIKEENKKNTNDKYGSGAQAHVHHGEAGGSSPRDSAVYAFGNSAKKAHGQSHDTLYDTKYC